MFANAHITSFRLITATFGSFQIEIEAAIAYNQIAEELLGWKTKLNIISQEEIIKMWEDTENEE